MSLKESLKNIGAGLLGLRKWELDKEHFFVIPKTVYEEFAEMAKDQHPNEFFFYIFAEVKESPVGKLFIAKRVVESKERHVDVFGFTQDRTEGTRRVAFPATSEFKAQANSMKGNEVLALCHTHPPGQVRFFVVQEGKVRVGPSFNHDVNNLQEDVFTAGVPLEKVLYGVFRVPKKNEKSAYQRLYADRESSILVVRAPNAISRFILKVLGKEPELEEGKFRMVDEVIKESRESPDEKDKGNDKSSSTLLKI